MLRDEESLQPFRPKWFEWNRHSRKCFIYGRDAKEVVTTMVRLVVIICLLTLVYKLTQKPEAHDLFRASRPVEKTERLGLSHELRPLLLDYWSHNNDSCGVAAPYVRRYERYMLTSVRGEVIEVFNPRVMVDLQASSETVMSYEISPMCYNQETPRIVERHTALWLEYRSLVGEDKRVWITEEQESVCLQHMCDILEGEWPCSLNEPLIPKD
jgi:peptide deformylase